jgi:hypothetical protein
VFAHRCDRLTDAVRAFAQDNEIHPCDDYTSRGMKCPDVVHIGAPRDDPKCSRGSQCRDVLPLRTLLRAVSEFALPEHRSVVATMAISCFAVEHIGCHSSLLARSSMLDGVMQAGIDDLDTDGDYKDENGHLQSYRYAGLVLTVQIKYTNHGPSIWCGANSRRISTLSMPCVPFHHSHTTLDPRRGLRLTAPVHAALSFMQVGAGALVVAKIQLSLRSTAHKGSVVQRHAGPFHRPHSRQKPNSRRAPRPAHYL